MKEKEALLQKAATDMEKMKSTLQKVVGNQAELQYLLQPQEKRVGCIRLSDDQEYFNSYAHFGIHHEMLSVSKDIYHRHSVLLITLVKFCNFKKQF